jgi:probable rRNA maturation factor
MRRSGRPTSQPQIEVRNLQRKFQVNLPVLQKFAQRALRLCLRTPGHATTLLHQLPGISVLLISDRRMAGLHRQFLHQPGSTDVITFQHGEIFVSAGTASRQARQFGNSLLRELQLYIVHGLLHLHGFDDRSKKDAGKMKTIQKKILEAARR